MLFIKRHGTRNSFSFHSKVGNRAYARILTITDPSLLGSRNLNGSTSARILGAASCGGDSGGGGGSSSEDAGGSRSIDEFSGFLNLAEIVQDGAINLEDATTVSLKVRAPDVIEFTS